MGRMVIGYWLLVIGYWLLVIGYWLLVTGYLVNGYLVNGYWFLRGVDDFSPRSTVRCPRSTEAV